MEGISHNNHYDNKRNRIGLNNKKSTDHLQTDYGSKNALGQHQRGKSIRVASFPKTNQLAPKLRINAAQVES